MDLQAELDKARRAKANQIPIPPPEILFAMPPAERQEIMETLSPQQRDQLVASMSPEMCARMIQDLPKEQQAAMHQEMEQKVEEKTPKAEPSNVIPLYLYIDGAGLDGKYPEEEDVVHTSSGAELEAWAERFSPYDAIKEARKEAELPVSDWNRLFGIPMFYVHTKRKVLDRVLETLARSKMLLDIPRAGPPLEIDSADGLPTTWSKGEQETALDLMGLMLETAKGMCWICLLPQGDWLDASTVTGLGHEPFSLASKKLQSGTIRSKVASDGQGGLVVQHCYLCEETPADAQLLKCSACKKLWYCSKGCQKKDWAIHKEECKTWKNEPVTRPRICRVASEARSGNWDPFDFIKEPVRRGMQMMDLIPIMQLLKGEGATQDAGGVWLFRPGASSHSERNHLILWNLNTRKMGRPASNLKAPQFDVSELASNLAYGNSGDQAEIRSEKQAAIEVPIADID